MNQRPLIGVAALGLAGLAIYYVPNTAHQIEHDIFERSTKELINAKVAIPRDGVVVDGRDVTLRGPRGSAIVSDGALDKVAKVWGVRTPVHRVIFDPPPEPVPEAMPVEAMKMEEDLTKFLAGKTIRFDVNSDAIHPEGRAVLDEVFKILSTSNSVSVDITGHTDDDGDAQANLDLSKRRAAAVKRYLVSRGIKAERLEAEGFGSAKPLFSNDTPENKARNRRIEFHANSRIPGAGLSNR